MNSLRRSCASTSRRSPSQRHPSNFYGSSARSNTRLGHRVHGGPVRTLNFDAETPPNHSNASPAGSQQENFQWLPGQTLPYHSEPRNVDIDHGQILIDQMYGLQNSLDSKLQSVCSKLEVVCDRMAKLEERQQSLEEKLPSNNKTPASTPDGNSLDKRRKRHTPCDLQSNIRAVHSSFAEDAQFKPEEPISSTHNVQTVRKITEAIGTTEYSADLIRKGCQTYKKTLASREKQSSTPIRKKKYLRSLKQRSFERRGRAVQQGKEAKFWSEVTAYMMSDEEKVGHNYVRHPPAYRSTKLNDFIDKLDKRLAQKISHPRTVRLLGSPSEQPIPSNVKSWMVQKESRTQPAEGSPEPSDNDDIVISGDSNVSETY